MQTELDTNQATGESLRTQPQVTPFLPMHLENKLYGETYGVEAAATWEP